MKKVGELLDMAGLDKEVVKSVTEKLADEEVSEADAIKHEEAGRHDKAPHRPRTPLARYAPFPRRQ